VSSMSKRGDSFGEQALINSKPRAATIRCSQPSFFAVMTKLDYERSLGKIQKKQMNKMIEFLKQCPHFKSWTRTNLVKLTYYFKKKKFRRGNYIYKKDDPCRNIYIVYSGEFEQTKFLKIEREEEEYFDYGKYIFKSPDFQEHHPSDGFRPKKKTRQQLKIADEKFNLSCSLLCQGQLIGEEDAIQMRNHTKTVKCKSFNGELLVMSLQDFYQRVKAVSEDSWKKICENSEFKTEQLKLSTEISLAMRKRKLQEQTRMSSPLGMVDEPKTPRSKREYGSIRSCSISPDRGYNSCDNSGGGGTRHNRGHSHLGL